MLGCFFLIYFFLPTATVVQRHRWLARRNFYGILADPGTSRLEVCYVLLHQVIDIQQK